MATNTKTLLGAALMSLSLIATAPAFADPQQRDDPRHDPQPPQHGAPGRPSQGTPPRQGQWPQQSPPPRADHHDARHHAGHRAPPKRGDRLDRAHRGELVRDYARHGLRKPPRGHEWRKVDDRYVLIAVTTGISASVIAASR